MHVYTTQCMYKMDYFVKVSTYFLIVIYHTQEAPPLMPTFASGKYHIKWNKLEDIPAPMYHAFVTVQDKKFMLLVEVVQLMMLCGKCMFMMSTLIFGVGYLSQVTIVVFLKSSVASWPLLVELIVLLIIELIKFPHLMNPVKNGHLIIQTFSQSGTNQGWLLTRNM